MCSYGGICVFGWYLYIWVIFLYLVGICMVFVHLGGICVKINGEKANVIL